MQTGSLMYPSFIHVVICISQVLLSPGQFFWWNPRGQASLDPLILINFRFEFSKWHRSSILAFNIYELIGRIQIYLRKIFQFHSNLH